MLAFDVLPYEVLSEICSKLDPLSALIMRQVSDRVREAFEHDKRLLNIFCNVNWAYRHDITATHLEMLSEHPIREQIKSLRLTSVRSISASDLGKHIFRMVNLEELYITDTNLKMADDTLDLFLLFPKLRILAVSLVHEVDTTDRMSMLRHPRRQYLHVKSLFAQRDLEFLQLPEPIISPVGVLPHYFSEIAQSSGIMGYVLTKRQGQIRERILLCAFAWNMDLFSCYDEI